MPRLVFVALMWCACGPSSGEDSGAPGGGGPRDRDRDGSPANEDCDDDDPTAFPGAPRDGCDGVDNDCDGVTDEDPDLAWYFDGDGDGFGDAPAGTDCTRPAGTSAWPGDCDDSRGDVFPGAEEHCDGVDEDCDGATDDGAPLPGWWYDDADGDGAGDPATGVETCTPRAGQVANADDCDDTDPDDPTWVSAEGLAGATGRSGDPLDTIQAGVDRGVSCVWVGEGRYYESLDLDDHEVWVRGTAGSARTWVIADDGAPNLLITGGQTGATVIEGFTFEQGSGVVVEYNSWNEEASAWVAVQDWRGGGVYIKGASPTLRDVRITYAFLPSYTSTYSGSTLVSLQMSHGGAIFVENGTVALEDVWLSENYAVYGGSVWVHENAGVVGRRVRVEYSSSSHGGAIYNYRGTIDLENLVLNAGYDDYGYGGLLNQGGDTRVTNATIVDSVIGIAAFDAGSISVHNSVVAHNDYYGLYELFGYEKSEWTIEYNDVYGNGQWNYGGVEVRTGQDGNLEVDPLFTTFYWDGAGGDDLHLREGSPVIDQGDPAAAYYDADGTRSDMGAFGGPEGSGW